MKKKVSDLEGWVPQPGGAKAEGDRVPHAAEVYIERVVQCFDDHILFTCRFVDGEAGKGEARSLFYDFQMLDAETLPKIVEILNGNIGKTLLSIGEIEIPSD